MRSKRTARPVPPHVRRRVADRNRKLRALGYRDYNTYLTSPHWRSLRARYRASDLPQRCMCGERSIHFHHKTYERLGAELLTDLTPLCQTCHDLIHVVDRTQQEGLDFDHLRSPERARANAELDPVTRARQARATGRRSLPNRPQHLGKRWWRKDPTRWGLLRWIAEETVLIGNPDFVNRAGQLNELLRDGYIIEGHTRKRRLRWYITDAGREALHL